MARSAYLASACLSVCSTLFYSTQLYPVEKGEQDQTSEKEAMAERTVGETVCVGCGVVLYLYLYRAGMRNEGGSKNENGDESKRES